MDHRYIICTMRIVSLINDQLSDNIPTYFDSIHTLESNSFSQTKTAF